MADIETAVDEARVTSGAAWKPMVASEESASDMIQRCEQAPGRDSVKSARVARVFAASLPKAKAQATATRPHR